MRLPDNILAAMEILEDGGFESYVVGGCVRDAMMGITPHDYDLTTSATPEEMLEIFSDFRIIETGLKHGTVTVVIENENIEITTFRVDGEYSDNRHPDSVKFTKKLEDDLSRRDFTVNAMAYSPKSGIVDLFSGKDDLKKRIIRCVGNPDERFNEDGLRILRGLRFASQLGFSIDDKTADSIKENRCLLENISVERIYAEFTKLLCGKTPGDIIENYRDVISVFLPCEDDYYGFSDSNNCKSVRYAYFLRNCKNSAEIMRNLRSDNVTIKTVSDLVRLWKENFDSVKSVRYLLKDVGYETAEKLILLMEMSGRNVTFLKENLSKQKNACVTLKDLEITGADLLEIGARPGKTMGDILDALLDGVICDRLKNERVALLEHSKTLLDNSFDA